MREYILTEKEIQTLKDKLENSVKGNHYYVLVHRLRRSYEKLRNDMNRIEQVLSVKQVC